MSSDVVLLGVRGDSTRVLFHALSARFGRPHVILENRVARVELARRRARKIGWVEVAGQVLFATAVAPALSAASRAQREAIAREHGLSMRPLDGEAVEVPSVNSSQGRYALARANPDVVVVSGTRIISSETLVSIPAPFINLHAGITPRYRGVHGGYWALADGRPDLVGSTVHVVDPGIDTGAVIEQVTFPVTKTDSFATLPLRHLAAGVPAILRAVDATLAGTLTTRPPMVHESNLQYHPTAWGYTRRRLTRGVK